MAQKPTELLDELEEQFSSVQQKILKVKDGYVNEHRRDYEKARNAYQQQKKKLEAATRKAAKDAERFRKSGTRTAQNQFKKARAVAVVMKEALTESREIMRTAQDKLKSAKPFEKKLAARARAIAAFEKEWEKKQKAQEKAKQERARKRKTAKKQSTSATSKSTRTPSD